MLLARIAWMFSWRIYFCRFVSKQRKISKAVGMSLVFWLHARELRLSVCFNTFHNYLVPRGRDPFGQRRWSRPLAKPLARSNTGKPRFTDFPSLCACRESSLTNLIGSGLSLLCLHSHWKLECRWTWPGVPIPAHDKRDPWGRGWFRNINRSLNNRRVSPAQTIKWYSFFTNKCFDILILPTREENKPLVGTLMTIGDVLEGYSQENWVGVCGQLPPCKTFTLLITKIGDIPYPIYDLNLTSKS